MDLAWVESHRPASDRASLVLRPGERLLDMEGIGIVKMSAPVLLPGGKHILVETEEDLRGFDVSTGSLVARLPLFRRPDDGIALAGVSFCGEVANSGATLRVFLVGSLINDRDAPMAAEHILEV